MIINALILIAVIGLYGFMLYICFLVRTKESDIEEARKNDTKARAYLGTTADRRK